MTTNNGTVVASDGTTLGESITSPRVETFGSPDVRSTIDQLDSEILTIDEMAGDALKAGDRKGVLLAMRVSSTLERARKSIRRSLERANRVRKSKDGATVELVDDIEDDDDDV